MVATFPAPPATVYLSARFFRKKEMLTYAALLRASGFPVAARWLERDEAATPTDAQRAAWANEDLDDVIGCDWFITSTECRKHVVGDPGYGGRMVELGAAVLAQRERRDAGHKRITVIGPREGIFTFLPEVEHYLDWPTFIDRLTTECAPW